MGLDMYLRAEKYVSDYSYEQGKNKAQVNAILASAGFDRNDISEDSPSVRVSFNVLYWRKMNAIHNWFVNELGDGVDDCKPIYVSRDDLDTLACLCADVIEDPNNAEDILPTQDGFFFGGTDYSEYYFEEVERTRQTLNEILNNPAFEDCGFEYRASW